MKRKLFYALFFIGSMFTAETAVSQTNHTITPDKSIKLDWLNKWFSAWELVCKEELKLTPTQTPQMLFFDDTYVYATSDISIPAGQAIDGPSFFGKKLSWKMAAHNGQLTLPDGQQVPVGLMSFAGSTSDGSSFFTMAAPAFWKSSGIESKELGLDKLLTGVFLHEFAHTQQQSGFGAQVTTLESTHTFDLGLSDDIIQDYFKKDSSYVPLFNEEVRQFYEAAFSKNKQVAKRLAADALSLLKARQTTHFSKDKAVFKELDDIFLSMEGMGQYVAVAWLIHPKGGKLPFDRAVEGFRRKRTQWSQEEGLGLFLLYKKIGKPKWSQEMFSSQPQTIVQLLEEVVGSK